MWIQRSPEEVARWQKAAAREAASHGRLVAGAVWILIAVCTASGWFFVISGGAGMAVKREVSGGFWLRLPLFGLVAAPFAYWIFQRERRKELAKIARRTICPACDTAADGNAGAACQCGGSFVLTSTMKWTGK